MIRLDKPCPQCGGTGLNPVDPFRGQPSSMDAYGHLSYAEDGDPCPSCFGGMVPDDATVEAAAAGIKGEYDEVADWWDEEAARFARSALVAAARYQSEGKPDA